MNMENIPIENLSGILAEMAGNGIKGSLEQSRLLERGHGVKIATHFTTEFKYRGMHRR